MPRTTADPRASLLPRPGMLAAIRRRVGRIQSVDACDAGEDGRVHLVRVEYADASDREGGGGEARRTSDAHDTLVWEREPGARVLAPAPLPDPASTPPLPAATLGAIARAARWGALAPLLDEDLSPLPRERRPLAAPVLAGVQLRHFQLVPLLAALRMPRIALLLADDVGLGKTIEAGLILSELLIRQRIRRILIACSASLCTQWQAELDGKFGLVFDIVDRVSAQALRRRQGPSANPWGSFDRIITSYHYLKRPGVLDAFRSASVDQDESFRLPWDLLIVDEAHHLAPAPLGDESALARMLGFIAPLFEHRLFLTATPHNGHTRSFTGLLERLDPVRFTRTSEVTQLQRAALRDAVVRRLKREVAAPGTSHPFVNRSLRAIPLTLGPAERSLAGAFRSFRTAVRALFETAAAGDRAAGHFAVEVLGKRLLSCPVAFADSWHRYRQGLAGTDRAMAQDVGAAGAAATEPTGDDGEAEERLARAARLVGAWLRPFAPRLAPETHAVDRALEALGLADPEATATATTPLEDARFDALCALIDQRLRRPDGAFCDDERLVVFTEYKTTLDSLVARLTRLLPDPAAVRTLLGGMREADRAVVLAAMNDPADPTRVLLATDAAAEGLNLQATARLLLHFDVPWNPARLEQRNGRLDRHGQSRDVIVHHFSTDDDADLAFLAQVVGKVHAIREDLGSIGEVFDSAFQRRFVDGAGTGCVPQNLELKVAVARQRALFVSGSPADSLREEGEAALERVVRLAGELGISGNTLDDALSAAARLDPGRAALYVSAIPPLRIVADRGDGRGEGREHVCQPATRASLSEMWRLRLHTSTRGHRPLDPDGSWPTVERVQGPVAPGRVQRRRPCVPDEVSTPRTCTCVRDGSASHTGSGADTGAPSPDRNFAISGSPLHPGHPRVREALAVLRRERFSAMATAGAASLWTVHRGAIPAGTQALIELAVEEVASNAARETVHHTVRTFLLPVIAGRLGPPLLDAPDAAEAAWALPPHPHDIAAARALWCAVQKDLRAFLIAHSHALDKALDRALALDRAAQIEQERRRFHGRAAELGRLMRRQTLRRLERELSDLRADMAQGTLFENASRLERLASSRAELQEELRRRKGHLESLLRHLSTERRRVLEQVIPRRFTLAGETWLLPVALVIRLPREAVMGAARGAMPMTTGGMSAKC